MVMRSDGAPQPFDALMLLWVGLWLIVSFLLFNGVAVVNIKVSRLPELLNCVNFGYEIDQDKACVVANLATCDASLKMYNVRVDRAAIMRVAYYTVAVVAAMLPRLLGD
mmetsp:Transcript_89089/g.238590  ORF Transcript_89089/g.238590 Transcript_89089/m.238590 type:complete len:109 (-) Transcript_89089:256-582(-)